MAVKTARKARAASKTGWEKAGGMDGAPTGQPGEDGAGTRRPPRASVKKSTVVAAASASALAASAARRVPIGRSARASTASPASVCHSASSRAACVEACLSRPSA